VNGSVDEGRARLIVARVVEAGRSGGLPVLSRFQRLVRLDRALHSALVESAAPLAPDQRRRIEESLTRLYGDDLTTSFSENPSLIGGVSVKVGSDVYDGSVAGGLAALEAAF
jgi:F-type H+-transporting ATPase subunit delta